MTNIVIAGVGGQGIVLCSKLLSAAATRQGAQVRSAETIGMAQKGGSVTSFLRISQNNDLYSPLFPKHTADLLIAFEPSEAVRNINYLKKGGTAVVNTHPTMPVTAALTGGSYSPQAMTDHLKSIDINLLSADFAETALKLGSPRVMNMLILAAAVRSGCIDGIDMNIIEEVMTATVKPQFVEMNLNALRYEGEKI